MRLAHIKLAGFKSFVDPTHIPLPGQLVGIVGPNGCGKSNIIDAVRWVLGESRASALRGESMQDVIFNGSLERKPVSRAVVELVFDNSLGKAGGQWSQYAEIAVKRVIERNGESSYYINNLHVRRRDVQDIFLGTGLGGRPYAIIEQGMISRIIEARPEELRVFLEEAAGVSKYRERRRETELRLEDARENLARVDDIRQELEKQLERLQAQAQVAARYHELQARLRTVQALLALTRRQEAAAARERLAREMERLETALQGEIARLREAERHLEEARERHYGLSDALHGAQGALYQANAEVARLEQQLQHLRASRSRIEQQLGTTRNLLAQHEERRANAQAGLAHWRAERERATEEARLRQERAEGEGRDLPRLEEAHRAAQARYGEAQRERMRAEQAREVEQTHLSHAERVLAQLAARRERLEEEWRGLPQGNPDEGERLARELEDIDRRIAQQEAALAQGMERLPAAQAALEAARQGLQAQEQRLTEVEARRAALEELQRRLESNERLTAWLSVQGLQGRSRFWQAIAVGEGWEDALEAVLRERLNAVALEALDEAGRWSDGPPPGKLACFEPRAETVPSLAPDPDPAPRLRAQVTCRDEGVAAALDDWLAGVFLAQSLEAALERRHLLQPGQAFVLPGGHLVTRASITYYVPDSGLHGVLAREREIEALAREGIAQRAAIEAQARAVAQEEEQVRALEAALEEDRSALAAARQRRHEVQMAALKAAEAAERVRARSRQIAAELEEIDAQERTEKSRREAAIQRLEEIAGEIAAAKQAESVLEEACRAAETRLGERRQAHQQALHEAQEAVYHEKLASSKINELEDLLRVIDQDMASARASLEALEGELSGLDPAPIEAALQAALEERQSREESLAQARDALEEASARLRSLEESRLTIEQGLEPLRQKLAEAQLKEQEARLTVAQFEEQLRGMGADEEALAAQLGEKPRASSLQGEITRLNNEIAELGAVNLAALEELKAAEERKAFLDAQSEDLRAAVETLENAIRRIDRETRERLMSTFDQVNNHLAELFPTLFGGGQARLVLTGEEILDAGLQVIAQPPGKKNTSIHLLSGGEKALTALALVFSLFQLNPAPFCLLDEVDAPLDDTNTERFCQLVKRMAQQTQFIFISHNKLTMEIAHQLIGITMQEQGVSRVVAVDVEEAMRLRDAAAA
ncbi:MAG: chromosome partition protein Smc [Burkholderiales bacterium]|nr:MAG: chromosome partition protein Smc [Burkholderiales bacterium]